jgi:hypothetical protein
LRVVEEPSAREQLRHPGFVVIVERPGVVQPLDEEQVRFQAPEIRERLVQRERRSGSGRPPFGRVRVGREADDEALRVRVLRLQPPRPQQRRQEHRAHGGAEDLAA